MQPNERTQKIVRIIVCALLCAEMSTTFQREQSRASNFNVEAATSAAVDEAVAAAPAPHYASIRLIAQERRGFGAGHMCAGALVAPSAVLTVASCVQSRHPAELRVVLGSSDHYTLTAHTLSLGITHVIQGPGGSSGALQLSLLLLERDVPAGHDFVQPVMLPRVRRTHAVEMPAKRTMHALDAPARRIALNATQIPLVHCEQVTQVAQVAQVAKHCYCMRHDSAEVSRSQHAGAPLLTHNGDELLALKLIAGNSAVSEGELYVPVGPHVMWLRTQIGDGSNQNRALWGTLGFMAFTVYAFGAGGRKMDY